MIFLNITLFSSTDSAVPPLVCRVERINADELTARGHSSHDLPDPTHYDSFSLLMAGALIVGNLEIEEVTPDSDVLVTARFQN